MFNKLALFDNGDAAKKLLLTVCFLPSLKKWHYFKILPAKAIRAICWSLSNSGKTSFWQNEMNNCKKSILFLNLYMATLKVSFGYYIQYFNLVCKIIASLKKPHLNG